MGRIALDMNNRKGETSAERQRYELAIQDLHNHLTVQLGELRTEGEQAKWDITLRTFSPSSCL